MYSQQFNVKNPFKKQVFTKQSIENFDSKC